jgi:hypothetical protein
MLATIQSRTFRVLVCCVEIQKLEYTKLILPVLLYGCGTWSLTFREEQRQSI